MKLISIGILRRDDSPEPTVLAQSHEVNSFGYFQRSGRTFIKRTKPGQRQSIQHEEYNCHVHMRKDGMGGIVVTDLEYPPRVAFALLNKLMTDFDKSNRQWTSQRNKIEWAPMNKAMEDYQDPSKSDKISAIQKELNETTSVLTKTIDNVLERGEKLDDLVNKSADLSSQSKVFYKQAKKTNSCCILM